MSLEKTEYYSVTKVVDDVALFTLNRALHVNAVPLLSTRHKCNKRILDLEENL